MSFGFGDAGVTGDDSKDSFTEWKPRSESWRPQKGGRQAFPRTSAKSRERQGGSCKSTGKTGRLGNG